MPSLSQTQSGKAFEYALANAFSLLSGCSISVNSAMQTAFNAYSVHAERERNLLDISSREAVNFLRLKDTRLQFIESISIASDSAGQVGDVRDIVIVTRGGEVGISAKQRNDAIKHSRLSRRIDFGKKWIGYPCREIYFERVCLIFDLLETYGRRGMLFADIENKQEVIYKPILDAFEDEINFIWDNFSAAPYNLLQYLIGFEDFYWVIKERGSVSLLSCNIQGGLRWGKKWKMPTSIEAMTREGQNRCIIYFNYGWQISFRIHNARSICEPSLKFDVRILGWPRSVMRHDIDIDV